MEASSMYAIGSGIAAISGSPVSSMLADFVTSWWHKRRLRRRLSGLIILKGVSTLCQRLTTSDVVYIDCDLLWQNLNCPKDAESHAKTPDEVNPVDAMLAYAVIKNHIINICNVFKGKIVLVSKSLDLLHALPVKHDNIYFGAFSKDMETNISIIYSSEKEHHSAEVNKFRIMRLIDEDHTFIVDSLKDLYDKTCDKFGSKKVSL